MNIVKITTEQLLYYIKQAENKAVHLPEKEANILYSKVDFYNILIKTAIDNIVWMSEVEMGDFV